VYKEYYICCINA